MEKQQIKRLPSPDHMGKSHPREWVVTQAPEARFSLNNILKCLENGSKHLPNETDNYSISITSEKVDLNPLYPRKKIITEQHFEKFDLDTLYFIFYYQKGSYEQFLAARELKKKTWRFHKKFATWFKRIEPPRVTTDEFEQGTYVFFDNNNAWAQRKKADFTFKYSYLEDELNVEDKV
eukprot:TRINITY_DN3553_c0_g1_i1.p1 TRINITY_DN3553_c0_g1~~TRINITY_DN3553_c0_g1_i1.p1  ORF type:complete len:178 (-),score=40.70 TRINITY_DN3553_c0_g1_i1:103-636(-)